jgi:hypothetical protein
MIVRKSREEINTAWNDSWRDRYKTKKRDYMLGSFFTQVLTAITDTKDWKAIRIKTDPRYIRDSEFMNRKEKDTSWKVRFRL